MGWTLATPPLERRTCSLPARKSTSSQRKATKRAAVTFLQLAAGVGKGESSCPRHGEQHSQNAPSTLMLPTIGKTSIQSMLTGRDQTPEPACATLGAS